MITPAEVIWPLASALLAAVLWIAWLLTGPDPADIPTMTVGHSIVPAALEYPEQSIGARGWAGLAAEATRTDTLLWYASQVLDGGRL